MIRMTLARENKFKKNIPALLVVVLLSSLTVISIKSREDGSNITKDTPKESALTTVTPTSLFEENPDTLQIDLVETDGSTSPVGKAYLLRSAEGITHKITVSLNNPESGKYYEGWLVDQNQPTNFISTGLLDFNPESNSYELYFQSTDRLENYNFVVVTLETLLDKTPETHVLESFGTWTNISE